MLANPNWFAPRKYGGWGVRPVTWQGWVYVGAILIPFIIFQSLPFWSDAVRMWSTVIWLGYLLLDVGHVMIAMNRDEREEKIEALSDRNAVWAIVLILALGVIFQLLQSGLEGSVAVDPFILSALLAGAAVKTVSTLILSKKEL